MKTFVVAYCDWFEHELILEKVQAPDWRGAVSLHSKSFWTTDPRAEGRILCPENKDEMQQGCWDADCMMNVIEVG
jgi:hypothetical protein